MTIQVNTDNHIRGDADLAGRVESIVAATLGRFGDRITRVEVHLSDENSKQKDAGVGVRCRMEARPGGRQPVAVTADGATAEVATEVAAEKLEKLLDSTFDRLDDPRR
jgi:hypothetical protein